MAIDLTKLVTLGLALALAVNAIAIAAADLTGRMF